MRELSLGELPAVVGETVLNLIRRGADGSLRLSADRWLLAGVGPTAVLFRSAPRDEQDEEQRLEVPLDQVERLTWDRLPKQEARSQLRFHLRGGDLWTFSGTMPGPPADRA